MNSSARNLFEGEVQAIRPGAVNDEVRLALPGGLPLVAVVTHDSVRALGLAVGGTAKALVKAPWVMVGCGPTVGLAAANQWRGEVCVLQVGPVQAEVAIRSATGATVHAVITAAAVRELGLTIGCEATAIIHASQVVLSA